MRRSTVLENIALFAGVCLVTFLALRGTFALPWISDNFDHLRLIAMIRAGLRPAGDLLGYPFHGQTLPVLRLIFWGGTLESGMDATPIRAVIALVHACGAFGCAWLCGRWTGSRLAAWFGGILYAGAVGYVGQVFWWPSCAIFCLGGAFWILAIVPLYIPWHNPRRGAMVSLILAVMASFGLNGAAVAVPALAGHAKQARRVLPVFMLVPLVMLPLVWWNGHVHPAGTPAIAPRGVALGLWLVLTAPFRLFCSLTPWPSPGFETILRYSGLAWIPLLASLRLMDRSERRLLALLWIPALVLAAVVGAARLDFGPGQMYTNDRYYYWFLFPLVVQLAFILDKLARNTRVLSAALVMIVLAAALYGSRERYLAGIPSGQFKVLAKEIARGRVLPQLVAAAPKPLVLADGPLPFYDTYMDELSLAFLLYSEFPHGVDGVRVIAGPVSDAQGARENGVLNEWAQRIGLPDAPATVRHGRLEVVIPSWIDFRQRAYEGPLIAGWSWWEGQFRWMAQHAALYVTPAPGDLTVIAYAPIDRLRRKWHQEGITVRLTMDGQSAGSFVVRDPRIREYRIQLPAAHAAKIRLGLDADFVWKQRDLDPQSFDEREFSVAIFAIGYPPAGQISHR